MEIEAAGDTDGKPGLPRFRMLAYSGGPMRIAGWRYPVVIDLAGLVVPSQSRPIRFGHDAHSGVGHTDAIRIENGQLVATGIVSRDTLTAREVVVSSRNGFPWQASVGATVDEFEFVKESQVALANGREFAGPVNVVRKATLGDPAGTRIEQTFAGGSGYTGLDRFGRVRDLHFKDGSGNTIHRYCYGYDARGLRRFARATQAAFNNNPHDNDRSYLYAYDGLQRLTRAHLGRLNAANDAVLDDPAVPLARLLTWSLDNLGNWVGDAAANPPEPGLKRQDDTDGDGAPDATQAITHAVDAFNAITSVAVDNNPAATFVQDAGGNTVFDGQYVYQYDAWNRLIMVNEAGTLGPDDFDAAGRIDPDPNNSPVHAIGPIRYRFLYDALGRLIERQAFLGTGAVDQTRLYKTLHYYYDGVRILQEVVETPDVQQQGPASFHTEREYVYGPDYVDEFVAQVDDPGAQTPPSPMFMVQDANYNVAALAVLPPSGPPQVLAQYTWEPYGPPVLADHDASISEANENLAGHQGLFFHRLSVGGLSLAPGTTGLYANRNRWYAPALGRFLQRDPDDTGLITLPGYLMQGTPVSAFAGPVQPESPFAGGMSLYAYLGSQPLLRTDPSGLLFNVLGASGLALDIESSNMQVSMSLLGAIRGFTDLVSARNQMLDDLTGMVSATPDMSGIDFALGIYDVYQYGQMAMLSAGALNAGTQFAAGGLSVVVGAAGREIRFNMHHLFPKFLRGDKDGLRTLLPKGLHEAYHGGLLHALAQEGISLKKDQDWDTFFRKYPELRQKAWNAMMSYTRAFDYGHGTSLMSGLWQQTATQFWGL